MNADYAPKKKTTAGEAAKRHKKRKRENTEAVLAHFAPLCVVRKRGQAAFLRNAVWNSKGIKPQRPSKSSLQERAAHGM